MTSQIGYRAEGTAGTFYPSHTFLLVDMPVPPGTPGAKVTEVDVPNAPLSVPSLLLNGIGPPPKAQMWTVDVKIKLEAVGKAGSPEYRADHEEMNAVVHGALPRVPSKPSDEIARDIFEALTRAFPARYASMESLIGEIVYEPDIGTPRRLTENPAS